MDIHIEFEEPIGWECVELCEEPKKILGLKIDVITRGGELRKLLLWESIKKEIVYF